MEQLPVSCDVSCLDARACPGLGPTLQLLPLSAQSSGMSGLLFCPVLLPEAKRMPSPGSPQPPAHTTQFEELPHIWPREQVFEDPIHVRHSLPVVLRPGLGYHSGQDSTKFLQIWTGEPLKDTGLRL